MGLGFSGHILVGDEDEVSPDRKLRASGSSGARAVKKGSPARVLIVDDHQVLRDGLRSLLAGDSRWEVCGEATDGQEAINKVRDLHPDLVILDVTMPVKNGLIAAREIRLLAPSAKILMFSMHESPTMRAELKRVGADGFVLKSAASSDVIAAVARLLQPVS